MKAETLFRGIGAFMVFIFLLSVGVQYNDPDPAPWMLAYLVPAGFALWAALGRHALLSMPVALAYWAGAFYWMPHEGVATPLNLITDVKMASLGVEEWREAGGLAICAIWLTAQGVVAWANRRRPEPAP